MEDRDNNFDLVRLFAATQVAIVHIANHLHLPRTPFLEILGHFPGVPIFFFVSGFLVSRSFERADSLRQYVRNRLLRIFPGLWACFGVSLASVSLLYDLPWSSREFWIWLLGQITFFQFYNPEFLRGFGVGVLNGSLWTILVELQYYTVLPVLYWVAGPRPLRVLIATTVPAVAVHAAYLAYVSGTGSFAAKLLQVTILPWLGLFLLGVIAQRIWPYVKRYIANKLLIWLAIFSVSAVLFHELGIPASGNSIGAPAAIVLFILVLSAAFTESRASEKVLRGNDISYGVYLYHMPVVNAYLALEGKEASWMALCGLLAVTMACAIVSWLVVEKPALNLKRRKQRAMRTAAAPITSSS